MAYNIQPMNMGVDYKIAMSGEQPDFVNALRGGLETGGMLADQLRTGEYRQALQQHGAAAMNGDATAQNALAGFDPAAIQALQSGRLSQESTRLGMDQTRLGMEETRQRMRILDADQAAAAAKEAATLTATQKAEELAAAEKALKMMSGISDAATWDATAQQMGATQYVGQFGQKDRLLAAYQDWSDILGGKTEFRTATPEEAAAAGLGQINTKTGEYKPPSKSSGMSIVQGPHGLEVRTGDAAGGKGDVKFTEGQGKDNVYTVRAEDNLKNLEAIGEDGRPLADELTSVLDSAAGGVPFVGKRLGAAIQSDRYKTAKVAGEGFLAAILRKDTGAAITDSEMEIYGTMFLPQPFDGPETLKAKTNARAVALKALKSGMNEDQIRVVGEALLGSTAGAGAAGAGGAGGGSGGGSGYQSMGDPAQGGAQVPSVAPAAPADLDDDALLRFYGGE